MWHEALHHPVRNSAAASKHQRGGVAVSRAQASTCAAGQQRRLRGDQLWRAPGPAALLACAARHQQHSHSLQEQTCRAEGESAHGQCLQQPCMPYPACSVRGSCNAHLTLPLLLAPVRQRTDPKCGCDPLTASQAAAHCARSRAAVSKGQSPHACNCVSNLPKPPMLPITHPRRCTRWLLSCTHMAHHTAR